MELSKAALLALAITIIATLVFRDAVTLGALLIIALLNGFLVHTERTQVSATDELKAQMKVLKDRLDAISLAQGMRR